MSSDSSSLHANLASILDLKGTGFVSLDDVEAMLIANGYLHEKAEVLQVLGSLKRSADNSVAIADISQLLAGMVTAETSDNCVEVFNRLDRDCDGKITAEDLIEASAEIGFNFIGKEQAQLMVSLFDYDADGKLTIEEFEQIFK
jgi:Ca2+-binding EF-hand superfamily protein